MSISTHTDLLLSSDNRFLTSHHKYGLSHIRQYVLIYPSRFQNLRELLLSADMNNLPCTDYIGA